MRVLCVSHPTTSWPDSAIGPLAERYEVARCSALDEAAWAEAIIEVDAVVIPASGMPRSILDRARQLRLIQKTGAGYDRLDIPAATARGIPIAVTAGANASTVAEYTFLLMLSLGRGIDGQRASLARGDFRDYPAAVAGMELFGATVGIVGLGAIGIDIARKAAAFGMRILATSRSAKPEIEASLGIARVDLPVLLQQSDFVVLACPLTPETRGLIDAAALTRMKPTAYLINIARGGVIDEPALIDALRHGQIAGAGLDVFGQEPTPADYPLLGLPNVIATPHVAGLAAGAVHRVWQCVAENVDRVERGERPLWVVNPEVFETVSGPA